ncbi:MAG: glycoside hydrolase family 44 protein [Pyrinomonadaceae bacterium]
MQLSSQIQLSVTRFVALAFASILIFLFPVSSVVKAQSDQLIYTDSLQNGWTNYSWATVNLSNSPPVHGGTASASVTAGAYQAFYLHHSSFSTDNYLSLNFWIHGGASGGQRLQVQATVGGAAQNAIALQPLTANSWQQINIPLASLGVGAGANIDGFWIQDTSGATNAVFYVDDIKLVGGIPPPPPPNGAVTIQIDAAANNRAINPNIYGVAYASSAQLLDLNAPLNRLGGNNTSRYNWQLNADNRANDFYFESIPFANTPGEVGDSFIQTSKNGGAQPMLTVPIIDWIAKVGVNRTKLASFSIARYGAQTGNDAQYFPDAGNGIRTNGQFVTGNDPNDANVPNSPAFQQSWAQYLVGRWGTASNNGLRYYILDNEHSIWFSTHRDVQPTGARMDEIWTKMRDYAAMIKGVDAGAQVLGPEEWGWSGYFYSGYDQQYAPTHNWTYPDRAAHGNMDYAPWLLQKFRADEQIRGRRLLDVFTLHYYPQGGEFGNDVSNAMQLRRNRSTRSLWDPNYTDETWINDKVRLIPRMKDWVAQYYPGTKIGLTEYNWGAENHINGATAQADIYGILGREGLDTAARWTTPDTATPTFKAMKMYRNYDGNRSGFGEQSVSAVIPNPDRLSAFAAIRLADGALTVMVINKISGDTPVTINLANFNSGSTAQVWQLTATNQINRLSDVAVSNNVVSATAPSQSITLFVVNPSSTVLVAPSNLSGSAAHRIVTLSWQDNSADETGFVVERAFGAAAGASTPFIEVGRVAANQAGWQARSRYGSCFYRVRAVRDATISTPSNEIRLLIR